MRGRNLLALASLILLALLTACSGSSEDDQAEQSNAQWDEIQTLKSQLDAKRATLADLREQLVAADAAENADTAEAPDPVEETEGADATATSTPEELQAKLDELAPAVSDETDALYGRVVDVINNSGLVEGAELTQEQRQAFGLKADIDIIYAQEYIDRGGDYQRAIDIYSQALRSDPTNEKLLNAKAEAEKLQYMDEERFGTVEKGMTQAEVRALLGTVKNTNVREFTEQGRIGWFYRKEDGGAGGVYFREKEKGSDNWVVEISDYDAIKPPTTTEEEEG